MNLRSCTLLLYSAFLLLEQGVFLIGGEAPVPLEELNRAADEIKARAEYYLDVGFHQSK